MTVSVVSHFDLLYPQPPGPTSDLFFDLSKIWGVPGLLKHPQIHNSSNAFFVLEGDYTSDGCNFGGWVLSASGSQICCIMVLQLWDCVLGGLVQGSLQTFENLSHL